MISVDTNVLVRIVTNDDPVQAKRALHVFARNTIFIPKTVLLEMEWVLRHAYKLDRQAILTTFHTILGLPKVEIENLDGVRQAISGYEAGLDFADALHLASSNRADTFATFDVKFQKKIQLHFGKIRIVCL